MSKESSSSGGIGFVGLLTIVFIVLKLTNYIDWSWVWVLSPLWLSVCFVVVILILYLLGVLVIALYKHKKFKKEHPKFTRKSKFMQRVEKAQLKQEEERGKRNN